MANPGALFASAVSAASVGALATEASTYLNQAVRTSHKTRQDLTDAAFNELKSSSHSHILRGVGSKRTGSDHAIFFESRRFAQMDLLETVFQAQASGSYLVKPNSDGKPKRVAFLCAADRELKYAAGNDSVHMFIYDAAVRDMKRTEQIRSFASSHKVQDQLYHACANPTAPYSTAGSSRLHLFKKPQDLPIMEFDVLIVLDGVYYLTADMWGEISARLSHRIALVDMMAPPELVHFDVRDAQPTGDGRRLIYPQMSEFYEMAATPYVSTTHATYHSRKALYQNAKGSYEAKYRQAVKEVRKAGGEFGMKEGHHVALDFQGERITGFESLEQALDAAFSRFQSAEKGVSIRCPSDLLERAKTWLSSETSWLVTLTMLDCHGTHANSYSHDLDVWRAWMGAGLSTSNGDYVITPMGHYYIHNFMAVNRAVGPERNIVPNVLPKSWVMVKIVDIEASVKSWWPHIAESVTYQYVRLSEIMNVLSYVNSLTDETLYGDKAYATIVAAMRREHTSVNFTNSVVQEPLAKLGVMQIATIAQTVLVWARYVRERRAEAVAEFTRTGVVAYIRKIFGSMFDDTIISTLISRLKRVKELEGLIQVLPRTVMSEFVPTPEGVMKNTHTKLAFDASVANLSVEDLQAMCKQDDWANFEDDKQPEPSEDTDSHDDGLLAPSAPPVDQPSVSSTDILKPVVVRKEDGQAKLYHTEYNFLKAINAGPCRVIVHVVGAAPGMHYTYLAQAFPNYSFVLYDKPGRDILATGPNVECRYDYAPPDRSTKWHTSLLASSYALIDDHLDTTEENCWEAAQERVKTWTPYYDWACLKLNPLHYELLSLRYDLFTNPGVRPWFFTQDPKYYQGNEVRGFLGTGSVHPIDVQIPFEVNLKEKAKVEDGVEVTCPGRTAVAVDCVNKTKTTNGVRAFCDGCTTGDGVKHAGGWLCSYMANVHPRMVPGSYECPGCDPRKLELSFPVHHVTEELAAWRDSTISVANAASTYLGNWKDSKISPTDSTVKMTGEFVNVCGVPGSGKSRFLRKLALVHYLKTGQRVGVCLPMMELLSDYRGWEEAKDGSGKVVRKPISEFMVVKTRHKFVTDCSLDSFGFIAVDEVYTMSAVEIWYLTRYNVPILLVGDHSQQHLAETHGYGWGRCLVDNGMILGEWISHRFFLNYRNPSAHLTFANEHYKRAGEPLMIGMNHNPHAKIRVMTEVHELQAAYGRNGKSWRMSCEVMAFSKKGYAKLLPDEMEDKDGREPKINTVRSMQGATVEKPLVLIVDESFASSKGANDTGTNIVAFTRHKNDLIVYVADRAQSTIAWVKANNLWTLMEQTGLGAVGEVQEITEPLPKTPLPEVFAPPCNSAQLLLAEEPPQDDRHVAVVDEIRDGPLAGQEKFSGRINQNGAMDLTPSGVVREVQPLLKFSQGLQYYSSTWLHRTARQIMRTSIARAGTGSSKPLSAELLNALTSHGRRLASWVVGPEKTKPTDSLLYDSLRSWVDDAKMRHYAERFASANGVALNDFAPEFARFQEIIRGNIKQGLKMINVQKLMNDFTEEVNAWKPPTTLALAEMKKAGQMTATTNIALIIATAVYVRLFTRVMVSRMGKDYGNGIFQTSAYKSTDEVIECLEYGMRSTCKFAIPHASYEDSSGMDSKSTADYRKGPIAMLNRMAELFMMPLPVGGFENMVERFNKANVIASNIKFTKSEELASGIIVTWLMTTAENMFNSTMRVTPIPASFNYFSGDDAGRFQQVPFKFNNATKAVLDSSTNIKIVNVFNDGDGHVNKDPEPFIFELAGYSVYCDADMSPSVGTMMLRKIFKFIQTPEVLPALDSEAQALAVFKRLGPRLNSLRDYVKFVLENSRVEVEVTHMAQFLRQDAQTVDYRVHRERAFHLLASLISLVRIKAVDYQDHGQER